jgi:hypothetical protein
MLVLMTVWIHSGSVKQTFVDFLVPVVALIEGVVILDSWGHVTDWYIVAEVAGIVPLPHTRLGMLRVRV